MRPRGLAPILALLVAGCAAPSDLAPAPEPTELAPVGTWVATACEGYSLVWSPPLDALQEVVGPRWTPAPGPAAGTGIFVLFAARCPESLVDGNATEASTIAAALVPILAPEEKLGLATEGWLALPELVADDGSAQARLFAEAGFVVSPGAVELDITPVGDGVAVRMIVATANGTAEIDGFAGGEARQEDLEGAFVTVGEGPVGLFTGPESRERLATGSALARGTGDTWLSRLSLPPAPIGVAYDRDFGWEFAFSCCAE